MRNLWIGMIFLLGHSALAKETTTGIPPLEKAISVSAKKLPSPSAFAFSNRPDIAISSSSELAQASVNQGLNHLIAGWDIEASRHFAAAMKEDPECLMAHWGMVMTQLEGSLENAEAKNCALLRFLDLMEKGVGSEIERGYGFALIQFIKQGPEAAAIALKTVSDKFPNELHARVFTALFTRGGYDSFGEITQKQRDAEKILLDLTEKHPLDPLPLHALLVIRAEAPDLSTSLPLAKKLQELCPNYPPYQHLLGHYQWRCGEHRDAVMTFQQAGRLWKEWMKQNQTDFTDCPESIISECYRITALSSKGEFDRAINDAEKLANITANKERPNSPGNRALLWNTKTLPAMLWWKSGKTKAATKAAESLPKPDFGASIMKSSTANWWIDGLRFIFEAQKSIDSGNRHDGMQVAGVLVKHGERMALTQARATESGEISYWTRSFKALEILACQLRGNATLIGNEASHASAATWYNSGADREQFSSMLNPPLVLIPMKSLAGQVEIKEGKAEQAIESLNAALKTFPNDFNTLKMLKGTAIAANLPELQKTSGTLLNALQTPAP